MLNTIFGIKKTQLQKFLTDGTRIPVTEISVPDNAVVMVKNADKHGYTAFQLGIGINKKAKKAQIGQIKGAKLKNAPHFLKEVRVSDEIQDLNVGDIVKAADVFKAGDIVDAIGISKGKGYAGGVKRYHFKGGPRTHGQSDRERAPGSIGQTTTPGRVYKGKRMAGRMGHDKVTVKNLKIVDVSEDKLYIKGLVPGGVNTLIEIRKVGEDKKFVPLLEPASATVEAKTEELKEEVSKTETESIKSTKSIKGGTEENVEGEERLDAKEKVDIEEIKEGQDAK